MIPLILLFFELSTVCLTSRNVRSKYQVVRQHYRLRGRPISVLSAGSMFDCSRLCLAIDTCTSYNTKRLENHRVLCELQSGRNEPTNHFNNRLVYDMAYSHVTLAEVREKYPREEGLLPTVVHGGSACCILEGLELTIHYFKLVSLAKQKFFNIRLF